MEDTFLYSSRDFHFSINSKHGWPEKSEFDSLFLRQWEVARKSGLFKYSVEGVETKVLPGKYNIVTQLNSNRKNMKRTPDAILNVEQPFDVNQFNFTKVRKEEHLMQLVYVPDSPEGYTEDGRSDGLSGSVVINNAPICSSHSLLVPRLSQCLKQVVTGPGLTLALHSLLLSHTPDLRVGYNSMGGCATVNHLHFHLYFLPHKLYIETAMRISKKGSTKGILTFQPLPPQDCVQLAGPCYAFQDFYAHGFVFQLENGDVDQLARRVMKMVDLLMSEKVAHNLFMTWGTRLTGKDTTVEEYDTLRVIVWARKFVSDAADVTMFASACCELAGHVPVYLQEKWESFAEEDVTRPLHSTCSQTYHTIMPKVVTLFSDDDGRKSPV